MRLSRIDKKILKILKQEPLTTYKVAKKANISWASAISHCYKLKSYGMIEGRPEKPKFGDREAMLWWKF
jgi:predicted transcriptional regulator